MKKKSLKPFLKSRQEQISYFFSVAFLVLIFIGIIYFVNTDSYRNIGKASGALGCTEDWICSEWSRCSQDGSQARFCYDLSNCGTIIDKPAEEQGCVFVSSGIATSPAEQMEEEILPPSTIPERTSPWPFIILSMVAVVGLIAAGVYHGQRYIKMKKERESGQITQETIHQVYMYSLKRLKEGYKRPEVIQALRAEKWPNEVINQVFQPKLAA